MNVFYSEKGVSPDSFQCPPGSRVHELKTWPAPFSAILTGNKRHEVRKDDRDFQERDYLLLREWYPDTQRYSGRWTVCLITYKTRGATFGLPPDVCVLSISGDAGGVIILPSVQP